MLEKSEQSFYRLLMLMSVVVVSFTNCNKPSSTAQPPNPPPSSANFDIAAQTINSINFNSTQTLYGISNPPSIKISFSDKVDRSTVPSAITYSNKTQNSVAVPFTVLYQNNDSALVVTPSGSLSYLNEHIFSLNSGLKSV